MPTPATPQTPPGQRTSAGPQASLTASSSAQEALRALGKRLRQLRLDAGLSQRDLARAAGWHSSKISKIEYGKQTPSPADLGAWCRHCGAEDLTSELTASLHAVEGMFIEWRRMEGTGLRWAQESVTPLWENTRHFRAYNSWMIPGILQTRAYTHAALSAITRFRGLPDDVDAAVDVRMQRQRILHHGDHRFAVILEESVLRYRIGGTDTMIGQLGHLIATGSLPSVSLGIIPQTADRTRWPVEGFWIYDDTRVNVELVSGWLTITQPHEIALYRQAFTELFAMAVHGPAARALITAALDDLDDPQPPDPLTSRYSRP